MNDKKALERIVLATVSALDGSGQNRDEIAEKLTQLIPGSHREHALALVDAYFGEPLTVPVSPDCRRHLNLLVLLRERGYPVWRVTRNWLDDRNTFSVSQVLSSLRARMIYPLLVITVMVISFGIMQVKVLPTLDEAQIVLVGGAGDATEYAMRSFLFTHAYSLGGLLALLLLFLAAYPVAMLVGLSFVERGRSPPSILRLAPFMRRWMSVYATALYLESLVLIKDTVPAGQTRQMAATISGINDQDTVYAPWIAGIAGDMDVLDSISADAVSGVRRLCLEQVSQSVESAGAGYMILVNSVVALLVGYYVITMYGPILNLVTGFA